MNLPQDSLGICELCVFQVERLCSVQFSMIFYPFSDQAVVKFPILVHARHHKARRRGGNDEMSSLHRMNAVACVYVT